MSQLAEFGSFGSVLKKGAGLLILAAVVLVFAFGQSCLLVVGDKKAAILIRMTGQDLPPDAIIAPDSSYKGIQLETLAEGWHLLNPYTWRSKLIDQTEIPEGHVGVIVRHYGEPLPAGQVLAEKGQRGIVKEVKRPARYRINSYAESIEIHPAVAVPNGHVGVVTMLAGNMPANPNEFLVKDGERGVQHKTLPPGTYYLNPYYQAVTPIDTRSQKFDMSGDNAIHFPSIDGFSIAMEGTIEWSIDPRRIPEVFVRYVDDRKSDRPVIECVVEEIILPNGRSFSRLQGSRYLARDLLTGNTRQKFQEDFHNALSRACGQQGITIHSAVVRNINLPDKIALPIRERELTKRQRAKYRDEMKREKTERELARERKLQERQQLLTQAKAVVAVKITNANQKREVALIEANRALEVAKLELEAADNQAKAIVSKGQAEADVIRYRNQAEARGLADSRKAFGDPDTFVRYLLYSRLAPAMKSILSNTDGPFAEIFDSIANGSTQDAPTSSRTQGGDR